MKVKVGNFLVVCAHIDWDVSWTILGRGFETQ